MAHFETAPIGAKTARRSRGMRGWGNSNKRMGKINRGEKRQKDQKENTGREKLRCPSLPLYLDFYWSYARQRSARLFKCPVGSSAPHSHWPSSQELGKKKIFLLWSQAASPGGHWRSTAHPSSPLSWSFPASAWEQTDSPSEMHPGLRVGTTWQHSPAQQKGYRVILFHLISFGAVTEELVRSEQYCFPRGA